MYRALNGWRFIFALMIVWHHMPVIKPHGANFGNPIVTFFFVLSGFLLTLAYREKLLSGIISPKEFVIKRSATIFPLQWLFTLLFLLFSINVVTYWAAPFHLTLIHSLVPFWEINFTLNTPSWFLSSLFICYLFTPILFKFTERKLVFVLMFFGCVLSYHVFLYFLPESIGRRWLCYINPLARLQDYGAGILLALYWKDIEIRIRKVVKGNRFVVTLLELLAICLMCISLFNIPILGLNRILGVGSVLLVFFICIFISVFCLGIGVVSQCLSNQICDKLGKTAIAIFMSHRFILYYTEPLLKQSCLLYLVVTYMVIISFSILLESYYCVWTKQWFQNILYKKK